MSTFTSAGGLVPSTPDYLFKLIIFSLDVPPQSRSVEDKHFFN